MGNFDPESKRDLYIKFHPAWQANLDFAEMHRHLLRDGTYLRKFGTSTEPEQSSQFELRKYWSLAIDLCEELIDTRIRNLFRTTPNRIYDTSPYAAEIQKFISNVDNAGTGIDAFIRDTVLKLHYINGVDIVVDKQTQEAEPRSAADEKGLGVYLQAFSPVDRYDWSCDHSGQYLYARYCLGIDPKLDEMDNEAKACKYLTYTPKEWRIHSVTSGDNRSVASQSGEHSLGIPPIVQFYWKRSAHHEWDAIPISLLTRLTPIAEFMCQIISWGQLDLYNTVSFLVACGVRSDEVPKTIGASTIWAFNDPNAKVQSVIMNIEQIAEKRAWLDLLLNAMRRIGKMTDTRGSLEGKAQSGIQASIERTDLDGELSSTAIQLEQVETRLVQLAVSRMNARAAGGVIPLEQLGYSVQYNKRFALDTVAERIDEAQKVKALDIADETPSLMRIMLRRVLDIASKPGDADGDAALQEIADAQFAGTAMSEPSNFQAADEQVE